MVEINNNSSDVDRQEEQRIEDKKVQTRRDIERKMQHEGMKSFEAKLSEKTAHELENRQSQQVKLKQQGKDKEDKDTLLGKIIGAVQDKAVEENKSRVVTIEKHVETESEDAKAQTKFEENIERHEESHKEDAVDAKESDHADQSKGSGEVSEEGYRRVAERDDEQSGSGGQGFGQGAHSGEGSSSGSDSGAGTSSGGERDFGASIAAAKGLTVAKSGSGNRGFQRGARNFTKENLDEVVTAVQIGMNEKGEEEFAVELSDKYFAGLKVSAVRTDDGVVVKFVCPDVATRSTFLKFRPNVYAHFKNKGIKVHRIDVV